MTNHPKTLKEALEMFDEYYPDRISVGESLTGSYAREHMKKFITTIWHAGRESVIEDCKGMEQECSNCGGCGYTVDQGHGCDGSAEHCSVTCPIQVQKQCDCQYYQVYNQALTDVITKLSELKK